VNKTLIYEAQPIDFGNADTSLVLSTEGQMAAMGWTVYSPAAAFQAVAKVPHGGISTINEAAMRAATGAVAFLPSTACTVGVPAEIEFMRLNRKPVLVVTDLGDTSWVVAGWANDPNVEIVEMDDADIAIGLDWLRDRMYVLAEANELDTLVFERMHPNAKLPTKGYVDDAGFDLYAAEDVVIPALGKGMVSVGVAVDIPPGMWAQITGRSSTLSKHSLMVAPTVGVIDAGYTGELFAPIQSANDEDVRVEAGQRLAQLILHEAPGTRFVAAWGKVPNKERGSNGFGSTGL